MPSWHLHAHHAIRLLEHQEPYFDRLDRDVFLFGNFIPDIYVGYMVPGVITKPYTETHLAGSESIPVPDYKLFWDSYIKPYRAALPPECVWGSWAHLVADSIYNQATLDFLAAHGIARGEVARIKKQHDFKIYGSQVCPVFNLTPHKMMFEQAKDFCMYPIDELEVTAACEVATQLSAEAQAARATQTSEEYELFDEEWFKKVGERVDDAIYSGMSTFFNNLM